MPTIKLKLNQRSYHIVIGSNIIKYLGAELANLNLGRDAYIITNALVKKRYGNILNQTLRQSGFRIRFKIVPDTEKSKSINTASLVIQDLARFDQRRQIFIIAFGGGVIGDLAGFIASIYKRGVAYIQIPTTLLAQVDSSIGGKSAVDLAVGKNLVGTFYQPRLVFSDVAILMTLDLRQIKSGLAEVIKYGIIKDARLFNYLEKKYKEALSLKKEALKFIVSRCARIKAGIVSSDEKEEKGLRIILNFGHTLGHAIEAAGDYKIYNHGEAISLGMLAASRLSLSLGFLDEKTAKRIEGIIKKVGLPTRIERISLDKILKAHYRDKKFIGKVNRFVLIQGLGKTKIVKNIPFKKIKAALKERMCITGRG